MANRTGRIFYCDWIKRYVFFHHMISRDNLKDGEAKIEAFLAHLAVELDVSPSTQNQAMNALIFLYRKVLKWPLEGEINAKRATRKLNVPVVLIREEVSKIITLMRGTAHIVVKLLYGCGLRNIEALRVRVKDIDFEMKSVTVRSGKGAKDRITTFPSSITQFIQGHLSKVKAIHEDDLALGHV